MNNPYGIKVADFSQGMQGLMTGVERKAQFEQKKAAETKNLKMREEAYRLMQEGTPEEVGEYVAKNPGASQVFEDVIGITNKVTKDHKAQTSWDILRGKTEDIPGKLIEHGKVIDQQGGDATETIGAVKQSSKDPEKIREGAKKYLLSIGDPNIKAFIENERKQQEADFKERELAQKSETTAIKEYKYGLENPGFAIRKKNEADVQKTKEISKQTYKDSQSLRKEFLGQSKDYVKVRDAYTRVKGSTADPSPAGDLSLIFNYMKMLDPGSVVRESEFATAAATGSYGDRIQASVQKVMSGERLTKKQRNDFVSKASVLMNGMKKQHKKRERNYRSIASKNKLPVDEVVIDITAPVEEMKKVQYSEGQTATGPQGQKIIFRNGQWETM